MCVCGGVDDISRFLDDFFAIVQGGARCTFEPNLREMFSKLGDESIIKNSDMWKA